ncbi:Glycoside hydrolase family 3 protein [Mycena indigotica]|uniref:beta-glucosidase n=1 Tax=Mycena indigotica TaxID=2126181 RepID=A0A8H6WCT0_9AGAR|nr:Glycoside hydrolase family 3 protein [Mycena indigotica]KAF7310068.1 Glycoside hydrolase family 3 protein [Mycena indigotica]
MERLPQIIRIAFLAGRLQIQPGYCGISEGASKVMSLRRAILLAIGVQQAAAQAILWGQCGGQGWTGPTTCSQGVCTYMNAYYSQCIPGTTTVSTTTVSSTTSKSSSVSTTTPVSSSTSTTSGAAPSGTILNISPQWAAAYTKAKAAVAKLSLQDKVNLGTGVGWEVGHCVGNTPAISSISFPGLCLEDSPVGVRDTDLNSVFPAAINVAATFNRTLMNQRGSAMGAEFKGKGVHAALGPMMNLMRAPAAGRNWEGFGGDPYLSGEGAFQTINGIQSAGVQATAKHYINNEQEHFRETILKNYSTQHELYSLPFLRSVQANVASVMCSYNQINSSFACENDKTLNGILKTEMGFQGYVMSDWWATHSTLSVNAGLDMTMPGDISSNSGTTYFGANLTAAVNSGQISQARITDLATRILAAWYLVGQDSGFPAVNFDAWNAGSSFNQHVNVQGNHGTLIRQIDAASTVLLKNTGGALPLKAPATIGIIGNGAGNSSRGINGYSDRGGNDGVLGMGWGSGTANFPYLIAPLDAIRTRSATDKSVVTASTSDTDLNAARTAATGKTVALVFITADSGEGYITVEGNAGDRNNLAAWHSGDALVAAVAAVNKNTIVVVNSVGPITMESWITNPNITAVVWSGIPGQEAGNGLVDVLYGAYNPSGRLPYTIGKSISDYSAQVTTNQAGSITPINYSEGIFIDYRHFDQAAIAPRFEFGFGLSYTTFGYSGLTISGSTSGGTRQSGPGSSLDPWLHNPVVTVTFSIQNTGTLDGNEVPQLYLTFPTAAQMAPKNLKGFDSVFVGAGKTVSVSMSLSRFDFSTWNVATQRWEVITGSTTISIGASSRDIRLTGTITN